MNEHQSTYNPNMPIRGVIYFARLYEAYIKKHNLVQRFLNPHILSAWYFRQRKAEEGGNAVALLTDDNAAMA